jgi:sulfhydrogenase subunit beta (sulfur reductase)
MAAVKIPKKDLYSALSLIGEKWEVFVPGSHHGPDGPSEFLPLAASTGYADADQNAGSGPGSSDLRGGEDETPFDYVLTDKPLKELFFPRSESILEYRTGGDQAEPVLISSPEPAGLRVKRAVFGVRPCDAMSLTILDKVFVDGDCPDDFYGLRRKNTALVGLGCNLPAKTCFCTSIGGDPFGTAGLDVITYEVSGESPYETSYILKPLTPEGETLVEILREGGFTQEATESDEAYCRHLEENARRIVTSQAPAEAQALPGILEDMFDSAYWESLHEKCLGCAACTYLCPTCHCFDISEEPDPGAGASGSQVTASGGVRVKNWDSCMFPTFTLHTSGHNPRATGLERVRQRVMHKFYYFPVNSGTIACVGCGRCVKYCPVNLDIREVVSDIAGLGGMKVAESVSA